MATTLYPLLGLAAPSGLTLPSGYLTGSLGVRNTAKAGANACYLGSSPGSSQQSSALTGTAGQNMGMAQFVSDKLFAGTYAAGSIDWGFAVSKANGVNCIPTMNVYLVNGSTGATRTVVLSADQSTGSTSTSELTAWKSASITATFTAVTGDYLVVEWELSTAAATGVTNVYGDGSTAITADLAATSNAQAFITLSINLLFLSQVTTLYPRLGLSAPSGITLPSGYLSSPNAFSNAATSGANAKAISLTPGSSQLSSVVTPNSVTTFSALAQFCTGPLSSATGTIAALSTWVVGIGNSKSNAITSAFEIYAYLMNGATGAIRTQICSGDPMGNNFSATAEQTNYSAAVSMSAFTPVTGDYLLFEFVAHYASNPGASSTLTFWSDGATAITANAVSTTDAESYIIVPGTLVFVPSVISGTSSLGSGAGLAAVGVAQPVKVAGASSLGAGSGLAASGATALVKISGASSLGSGAGLTAAGVSTRVQISGTATLGSGAGLAAAGVATVVHVSAVSSFGSGASLTGAGIAQSGQVAGTSLLGSGSGLAGAGVLAVLHISAVSLLGAGAGLAGVGTFQSGQVAGTGNLGAGSGLSGVGVVVAAGTAGLFGGSGLAAAGLPFPVSTGGTAHLSSGASLAAQGVATPAPVNASALLGAGSGLAGQGSLAVVAVFGTANLGSGASLAAGGVAHVPAQNGTSLLGAGANLAAQGVLHIVTISAVSSFGSGGGIAGQGAPHTPAQVGVGNLGAGANLFAGGITKVLFVSAIASLGAGGGMHAVGSVSELGHALFGAGAGLAAVGVVTSRPPATIVTASAMIINTMSASAIIQGIVSASILSGELEVEE